MLISDMRYHPIIRCPLLQFQHSHLTQPASSVVSMRVVDPNRKGVDRLCFRPSVQKHNRRSPGPPQRVYCYGL